MFENHSGANLSSLGEFGLIDHLTGDLPVVNPETIKGVGDDAAVVDTLGKKLLISTDLLLENIHFDLIYTPLLHLGYKSIVVNLSDICAMNAIPKQVTISLGMSSRFGIDAVEELYKGMRLACEKYNVDIIGGDTSSSSKGLIISVTSLGYAREEDICYRSGASPNELICVSGDLGGAYTGLQLLEREKNVFLQAPGAQPDLEGKDYIVERQLKPEARTDIVLLLKDLGIRPTSMIDISDGLASEILHLCKASSTGCRIYENKIPIDPMTSDTAREFNLDVTVCALSGGEDYELLFTVKTSDHKLIEHNPLVTIIGHMVGKDEGCNLVSVSGNLYKLKAQGWTAFNDDLN